MDALTNKIGKLLTPLAEKISNNKFFKIVSMAFQITIPIIIIGALFSLLSSLQVGGYQAFIKSNGLWSLFNAVNQFTINAMSVYVVFGAAYAFMVVEDIRKSAIQAGLFGIVCFFLIIPIASFKVNKAPTQFIGFDYLGAKGIFTALIVGFIVGAIYKFTHDHKWGVKMPAGVPPMVTESFNSLFPGVMAIIVILIIDGIFNGAAHETFSEWFYGLLAAPLKNLSGSIWTWELLTLFASICWFFGIHGGQIIMPMLMLLFMQPGVQNQANYLAGKPMTNILTMGFFYLLSLGGIGNTIGLAIDMFFFSKSKRFKVLGKLAIAPSLFGINEPIMFGMPIVLNPIMAVPFFLLPQVNVLLTWLVMKMGWVALPRLAMGATMPVLVDGFLMCGISGTIWEIFLILLSMVAYLPFFKVQDGMAYNEEMKGNK